MIPSERDGVVHHRPSGTTITSTGTSIETPPRAPSPAHRFGTRAIHVGSPIEPTTGAVISPVSILCRLFLSYGP